MDANFHLSFLSPSDLVFPSSYLPQLVVEQAGLLRCVKEGLSLRAHQASLEQNLSLRHFPVPCRTRDGWTLPMLHEHLFATHKTVNYFYVCNAN
jgi:hypothetical protein